MEGGKYPEKGYASGKSTPRISFFRSIADISSIKDIHAEGSE
jgi:hypothetical protein